MVDAAVQAGEVPTGVLAVATGSAVVRAAVFSRPGGDAVDVDHIFLIAWIGEPILATAVLQLVEDGLLILYEPFEHGSSRSSPSRTSRWLRPGIC